MSMVEKVQAKLEPGEQLQFAVTAQTGLNPAWRWLTSWLVIANKARVVAITDRRVAVFKAGNWSRTTPRELLYSAPRSVALPHKKGPWSKVDLGAERVWLPHKSYNFLDAAEVPQLQPQPGFVAQPQIAPQPAYAAQVQAHAASQPAVAQATAAATAPEGAWYPDPTGRHQLRWWDAAAWTATVSDAGVVAVDPLG